MESQCPLFEEEVTRQLVTTRSQFDPSSDICLRSDVDEELITEFSDEVGFATRTSALHTPLVGSTRPAPGRKAAPAMPGRPGDRIPSELIKHRPISRRQDFPLVDPKNVVPCREG